MREREKERDSEVAPYTMERQAFHELKPIITIP